MYFIYFKLTKYTYGAFQENITNFLLTDVRMDLVVEDVDTFNDLHGTLEVSAVITTSWNNSLIKLPQECIKKRICRKNAMSLPDASEIFWVPYLRMPNLIHAKLLGFYGGEVPTQLYYE